MTIAVVMGVSGSGKTTVAAGLATQEGWILLEGDSFHPPANIAKMKAGTPLTDEDRWPWLRAIAARQDELRAVGQSAVVACSALKRAYRDVLSGGRPDVVLVYLRGPRLSSGSGCSGGRIISCRRGCWIASSRPWRSHNLMNGRSLSILAGRWTR